MVSMNKLCFFYTADNREKFALLLTRLACVSYTLPEPLSAEEHPAPTNQGYKGLTIPVMVMVGFTHPPFCLKEKRCTPGQNFKNKHGI